MPSSSPDGKVVNLTGTGTSSSSDSDTGAMDEDNVDNEDAMLKRPDFRKKSRKVEKSMSRNAAKKVRRLARARESLKIDAAKATNDTHSNSNSNNI